MTKISLKKKLHNYCFDINDDKETEATLEQMSDKVIKFRESVNKCKQKNTHNPWRKAFKIRICEQFKQQPVGESNP